MKTSIHAYLVFVLDNLNLLSSYVATLLLLLTMLIYIVKAFKTPEIKSVCAYLFGLMKSFFRHVERTIHPPGMKKHPKVVLLLGAAMTGVWYVHAVCFLLLTIAICGLLFTHLYTPLQLSLLAFYTGLACAFVCQLACFYYWSVAQQDRTKLNKQWLKLMGSNWFKKSANPA